jgi:hypothetical protein
LTLINENQPVSPKSPRKQLKDTSLNKTSKERLEKFQRRSKRNLKISKEMEVDSDSGTITPETPQ